MLGIGSAAAIAAKQYLAAVLKGTDHEPGRIFYFLKKNLVIEQVLFDGNTLLNGLLNQLLHQIAIRMLQTERLFLVPANLPMLEAIAEHDWATLSALLGGVDMADHWLHFPEAMIWMRDFLQEHEVDIRWWNYLIIHRADVRLIGTCGYKGTPGFDGEVEIGYEIAESYQGNGLATEAARALVENAFSHEVVKMVIATTLAEKNASNNLLQKIGFQFVGEHLDMEDGKIWEWRLERTPSV